MSTDRFLGTWDLIPELSIYELGTPPASGRYTISSEADGVLDIAIVWTTAEGAAHETSFSGPPNGARRPIEAPGIDAFSITRVDERTLDSEAFSGDRSIAYARRVASNDGALLVVVQRGNRPDGDGFQNVQVYRRATQTNQH